MRKWWLSEGKNWAISKAKVLVVLPFTHPDRTMWVSAMLASAVDLNLRPPSWLGWTKLLDATMNWSLLAITFLTSFPRVLRSTIGRNAFGLSYEDLFGLGMTTVVDTLKYLGQWLRLMHASAMLMILERQTSSLMISFQCLHVILSGPGADMSVHLPIADLNSYPEKEFQVWRGLWAILSRMLRLTGRWRAVLKVLWRAVHRHSGVRQGQSLCVITSVAGSFLFLT